MSGAIIMDETVNSANGAIVTPEIKSSGEAEPDGLLTRTHDNKFNEKEFMDYHKEAQRHDPPEKWFRYCDHTADIQIHAWGEDMKMVYQNCALGMFNYICEVGQVAPRECREININGKTDKTLELDDPENPGQADLQGLLFTWLDECLFIASCEPYFMAREVLITHFDAESFKINALIYGDNYDAYYHQQGTEIKAITYSAMQIVEHEDEEMDERQRCEIFVVVDI